MVKFVKWRESDYWTAGFLIQNVGAIWIAWATQKNDPWREGTRIIRRVGIVRYFGENSKARGLVLFRLKVALMWASDTTQKKEGEHA